MKTAVIFGGTGFIGSFFARHLIDKCNFKKVYLYDNELITRKKTEFRKNMIKNYPQIEIIEGDVKKNINWMSNLVLIKDF